MRRSVRGGLCDELCKGFKRILDSTTLYVCMLLHSKGEDPA